MDLHGVVKSNRKIFLMGRPANDGRGRLGGRAVGTKNKPLSPVAEWITGQLNRHRDFIEHELKTPDTDTGIKILSALLVAAALRESAATSVVENQIVEE